MEKDAKTVISNVKTYFVTDNTADKKGITNALKEVQQNAKPQDVFIFYYAGHGVIGKDNEFYLVPNNVSDLKNVQAELEQKAIAAKQLQQYAIDIQAQKQLFILDACQSAGAFEAMLSNDANQQKNIAVVARSTGTHWMAASGAQQFANEFSSLGHGAFTYVLLEALKGAASNNKMITVNNLKNYLQQTVPELMKKYHGAAQYPASYGFGNDLGTKDSVTAPWFRFTSTNASDVYHRMESGFDSLFNAPAVHKSKSTYIVVDGNGIQIEKGTEGVDDVRIYDPAVRNPSTSGVGFIVRDAFVKQGTTHGTGLYNFTFEALSPIDRVDGMKTSDYKDVLPKIGEGGDQ